LSGRDGCIGIRFGGRRTLAGGYAELDRRSAPPDDEGVFAAAPFPVAVRSVPSLAVDDDERVFVATAIPRTGVLVFGEDPEPANDRCARE
jgi:hypothetical protein